VLGVFEVDTSTIGLPWCPCPAVGIPAVGRIQGFASFFCVVTFNCPRSFAQVIQRFSRDIHTILLCGDSRDSDSRRNIRRPSRFR
jgi:hypothetical protein